LAALDDLLAGGTVGGVARGGELRPRTGLEFGLAVAVGAAVSAGVLGALAGGGELRQGHDPLFPAPTVPAGHATVPCHLPQRAIAPALQLFWGHTAQLRLARRPPGRMK